MEKHTKKWLKRTKIKMNENIFYKYKDIFQFITSGISNLTEHLNVALATN